MRFFRGNRFALIFFLLLIFCSAMVVSQLMVNQSRHVELREYFILLCSKEYPEKAERLYKRLLRELEGLPNKTLMDDYQRTFMLVYPATQLTLFGAITRMSAKNSTSAKKAPSGGLLRWLRKKKNNLFLWLFPLWPRRVSTWMENFSGSAEKSFTPGV